MQVSSHAAHRSAAAQAQVSWAAWQSLLVSAECVCTFDSHASTGGLSCRLHQPTHTPGRPIQASPAYWPPTCTSPTILPGPCLSRCSNSSSAL